MHPVTKQRPFHETLPLLVVFGFLLTGCGSPTQTDPKLSVGATPIASVAQTATAGQSHTVTDPTDPVTHMNATMAPVLLWRPTRPTRGTAAAPSPTFTSTAPASATEGTTYTYTIVATDPENSTITYTLAGPAGASMTANTLTWMPTSTQSRNQNWFVVAATTAAGGFATQTFSVTPLGTVRGTRLITYIGDSGQKTAPAADLATMTIAAYVPDGTGGFTQSLGTADTMGNFSIPNVAAGAYWLQLGTGWFWTDQSTIDAGHVAIGRPDAIWGANTTQLAFNISGMVPYSGDGDEIDWFVSNANGYASFFPSLAIGATTLSETDIYRGYLADASKGDQALVTQLSATGKLVAGQIYPIAVLKKVYGPFSITQANGATTQVSGTFADPPRSGTYRLNVQGSAFAAIAAAAHPSATLDLGDFFLGMEPDPTQGSIAVATVLEFIGCGGACFAADRIDSDIDFGDFTYGNPFPESWQKLGTFTQSVAKPYSLGAARAYIAYGYLETYTTAEPTPTQPFQPIVGAVTAPTINGMDLFQDHTGVGLTPTLGWSQPVLGTPNEYRIYVYRLSVAGSVPNQYTKSSLVATLNTTSSTVTVPPSVLVSGNSYFFVIYSVVEGNLDLHAAPFRQSTPFGRAPIFSGMITP